MGLVLETPTPAAAILVGLAVWPFLGWVIGLLVSWLSLHLADVEEPEDARQARLGRWRRRGLWIGIAYTLVGLPSGTWPPGTEVLAFPTLLIAAGAAAFGVGRRSSGRVEHPIRGMLLGGLAAVGAYAFVADPAAVLTVLGFAAWGPLLAVIWWVIVPGRSRPSEGSGGGLMMFITLLLSAVGARLVVDGDWRAPWLLLTSLAVVVIWIVGVPLALIALDATGGLFGKRTRPVRPLPYRIVGEANTGPIILLAHGFLVDAARTWAKPFIDGLVRRGCVVVLLEMPWGPEGDRPGLFEPVLESTRDALYAVMNDLQGRYPDQAQVVFGHSFGGGFGLSLVGDPHPAMRALLVTEPLGLEVASNFLILGKAFYLGQFVPGFHRLISLASPHVARRVKGARPQTTWFIEELLEFAKAGLAVRLGPKTLAELLRALPPKSVKEGLFVSALFALESAFVRAKSAARLAAQGIRTDDVPGDHDINKHQPLVVLAWAIRELELCGLLTSQANGHTPVDPAHPAGEGPGHAPEDPARAREAFWDDLVLTRRLVLDREIVVTPSFTGGSGPPRVVIPAGEWQVISNGSVIAIQYWWDLSDGTRQVASVFLTKPDLEAAVLG